MIGFVDVENVPHQIMFDHVAAWEMRPVGDGKHEVCFTFSGGAEKKAVIDQGTLDKLRIDLRDAHLRKLQRERPRPALR